MRSVREEERESRPRQEDAGEGKGKSERRQGSNSVIGSSTREGEGSLVFLSRRHLYQAAGGVMLKASLITQ